MTSTQIRGLPLERGMTLRKGRCHVDAALPGILENASAKLSSALRVLLAQLKLELDHLHMRIDEAVRIDAINVNLATVKRNPVAVTVTLPDGSSGCLAINNALIDQ